MQRNIIKLVPKWEYKNKKGVLVTSKRCWVLMQCGHMRPYKKVFSKPGRGWAMCWDCASGTLPDYEWRRVRPAIHPRHLRVA